MSSHWTLFLMLPCCVCLHWHHSPWLPDLFGSAVDYKLLDGGDLLLEGCFLASLALTFCPRVVPLLLLKHPTPHQMRAPGCTGNGCPSDWFSRPLLSSLFSCHMGFGIKKLAACVTPSSVLLAYHLDHGGWRCLSIAFEAYYTGSRE